MGRRKRDSGGYEADTNSWMVTFSDLVMLLLTFFVLLISMSSMDTKKLKKIFTHFSGALGVLELSATGDVRAFSDFIESFQSGDHLVVVDTNKFEKFFLMDYKAGKKLSERLKELDSLLEISDDYRGIVLSFQNDIMFDPGSFDLKPESFPVLDRIARVISAGPNKIMIMGHTDNLPVSGRAAKDNWELSVYRAKAVFNYLTRVAKIPEERFLVGGYGSSRPSGSNKDAKSRAKNRRVEIIFRHMQGI